MTPGTDGRGADLGPHAASAGGATHSPTATPARTALESPSGNSLPPSKFTVLLDNQAAADFDQLALDIRRLLGRRVSKGELVRALLAQATQDRALRDSLVDQLRAHLAT